MKNHFLISSNNKEWYLNYRIIYYFFPFLFLIYSCNNCNEINKYPDLLSKAGYDIEKWDCKNNTYELIIPANHFWNSDKKLSFRNDDNILQLVEKVKSALILNESLQNDIDFLNRIDRLKAYQNYTILISYNIDKASIYNEWSSEKYEIYFRQQSNNTEKYFSNFQQFKKFLDNNNYTNRILKN